MTSDRIADAVGGGACSFDISPYVARHHAKPSRTWNLRENPVTSDRMAGAITDTVGGENAPLTWGFRV